MFKYTSFLGAIERYKLDEMKFRARVKISTRRILDRVTPTVLREKSDIDVNLKVIKNKLFVRALFESLIQFPFVMKFVRP